ncbi:hypothetical protein [Amycolatopsis pretoriensis]|uniref:hypothetical protein n=1 Tax=Amycolatopsis pretoriensis TaxID=218821 RepID=UPI000AFB6770|nr:hypothetical protein [Amycolatopsis pretoriensis]
MLRRGGRGSEIPGENVEGPLRTFFPDEHRHPDVVVRLRGQRQVDRWLAGPVSASLGGC